VALRLFVGLTGEQAAEILGTSAATTDRWRAYARAWLQNEVRDREDSVPKAPLPLYSGEEGSL
jgi:DNA-directed RNA polymerase specialized sigma24 family protein